MKFISIIIAISVSLSANAVTNHTGEAATNLVLALAYAANEAPGKSISSRLGQAQLNEIVKILREQFNETEPSAHAILHDDIFGVEVEEHAEETSEENLPFLTGTINVTRKFFRVSLKVGNVCFAKKKKFTVTKVLRQGETSFNVSSLEVTDILREPCSQPHPSFGAGTN